MWDEKGSRERPHQTPSHHTHLAARHPSEHKPQPEPPSCLTSSPAPSLDPCESPSRGRGSLWGLGPKSIPRLRDMTRTDLWLGTGPSDRDLGLLLSCAPHPEPHSPLFHPSDVSSQKRGWPRIKEECPFYAPRDSPWVTPFSPRLLSLR